MKAINEASPWDDVNIASYCITLIVTIIHQKFQVLEMEVQY